MKLRLACLLAALLPAFAPASDVTAFDLALSGAERALLAGELPKARMLVMRALERDAKSPARLEGSRAQWAEAAGERDERGLLAAQAA